MSVRAALREHRSTAAGVALVLLSVLIVTAGQAEANHQPADKVVVSASVGEVAFAAPGESVQLLEETFRTSNTSDLLLQVTSECSLTTEVTTVGNDSAAARSQLKYHLEIETDGVTRTIGVASAEDDGSVVFCDRTYERETSLFDDENATIRTFMDTRTANAFNWVDLNTGAGIHTVRLFATFDNAGTTTDQTALAAVGRRTMIIEPVRTKNDEHVQDVRVD